MMYIFWSFLVLKLGIVSYLASFVPPGNPDLRKIYDVSMVAAFLCFAAGTVTG